MGFAAVTHDEFGMVAETKSFQVDTPDINGNI